jgi:hypothetical protein
MWLKLLSNKELLKKKEERFNRLHKLTIKARNLKIKLLESSDLDNN